MSPARAMVRFADSDCSTSTSSTFCSTCSSTSTDPHCTNYHNPGSQYYYCNACRCYIPWGYYCSHYYHSSWLPYQPAAPVNNNNNIWRETVVVERRRQTPYGSRGPIHYTVRCYLV